MNYNALQARAKALCALEGWTDVSPAPDWAGLVQQAWDFFSWDSECNTITESLASVSGQTEYSLTNAYKEVTDVTYNALGLLKTTEAFERVLNPLWLHQTAVTVPSKWALTAIDKIAVLPPPDAIHTILVRGSGYGAPLALPTDIPSVPSVYHEAIAVKAAALHGRLYATGAAADRLAAMEGYYSAQAADCLKAQR